MRLCLQLQRQLHTAFGLQLGLFAHAASCASRKGGREISQNDQADASEAFLHACSIFMGSEAGRYLAESQKMCTSAQGSKFDFQSCI